MIIFQIIYTLWCIPFAALNARWIEKGYRILHGWNGAMHLAAAIAGWYFWHWTMFFIILCNTRLVFDPVLNVFRGLSIEYVPKKPKSIVDRVQVFLFGQDFWTPWIIILLISIICNAIYFRTH